MIGEAMRDIILSLAVGSAVFYVDDAPIQRGFVIGADIMRNRGRWPVKPVRDYETWPSAFCAGVEFCSCMYSRLSHTRWMVV